MRQKRKSSTLSELAFCKIREDILNGTLQPDQKLQISKLKDHYQIGWSPLREALNRLSTCGFVVKREQQGFYVASVDEEGLIELTNARIWLDEIAFRQTFCRDTGEWEERIIIALHRLSKCYPPEGDVDKNFSTEWRDLHRAFHSELISHCGSEWLINYCRQLFDQFTRYRLIVLEKTNPGKKTSRREDKEHSDILNACLDRDVAQATMLMALHYKLSTEIILDSELTLLEHPLRVVRAD